MPAEWFEQPQTGNTLTIVAAVLFQGVLMLLPLVGPAGQAVPHAGLNLLGFAAAVLLTLAMSLAAVYSKWLRRQQDGSPWPLWSTVLSGACLLLLVAALTGQFSV
jgi:hypothetical protein